ncbi:member of the karyopherin-beta [Knufia obscura]|uniref:Member of the karyopherin-beta n=1 Tax=Knufia obscura TaxID=1635080 RepID=A0ABR0RNK6_9EURO|nr:member of the karyopherin-beta [Knufia obscura]
MEQLIRDLNSSRNQGRPDEIKNIERQLQALQSQPTAWQGGLDLLNSQSALLQFYGALTISLKVSADWEADKIGENREHVSQLLQQLVTRFVAFAAGPPLESNVIISKLSSTLAAVFGKPDAAWAQPCRHVLACILSGLYVPQKETPDMAKLLRMETNISGFALKAVLRLGLAIVEGVNLTSSIQTGLGSQVRLSNLASDIWQLIQFTLVTCSAHVGMRSPPVGLQVQMTDQDFVRVMDEALSQIPINSSDAASRWRSELLDGHFSPEANSFVEFLEAVVNELDATTDEYLKDNDVLACLGTVQSLLRCKGAAMVEDEMCQTVLDIMTTIAEGYSDWSGPSQFDESMVGLIKDVCLATLLKVQYPSEELDKSTSTWDEDDYKRFEDFRFQAKDFFQTAFGILGAPLIEDIAGSIPDTSDAAWPEFEAATFVLASVSDALSNELERCDPSLNRIFSTNLWQRALSAQEATPSRVRRSIITLLAETTSYLQRNPQHLISSLEFLFRSLQIRGHSNHAARAIYNLCDNQRSFLVQALPQFLQTLTTLEDLPLHSNCKVLSAVSALVQALPSEADKIEPLQKMLQLIQDLEVKHTQAPPTQDDEVYSPLFDRVSMLAAIARGLQSTTDTPIDLEATETPEDTFWVEGPGHSTQQLVLQMLAEPWTHLLEPDQSDLVSTACELLRAGFKESHPSPLKFSSTISTGLLHPLIDLKNPNLDQTMNTASCYVSSSPAPTPNNPSQSQAETLITHILTIATESTELLTDPTTNATFSAPTSLLDFIIRALPKYSTLLLTHPSSLTILSTILDYATLLLRSTIDTLPRRSAAQFFTSFLDITDPTSPHLQDHTAAANITTIMDKYSPTILGLTLHLLSGECARSEIDVLTQLLRAFITKQPLRAQRIMAEAMRPESGVLTSRALEATKPEQRARFVAQVEGLRGARRTGDVVREFWVSCRGGQFGYVT